MGCLSSQKRKVMLKKQVKSVVLVLASILVGVITGNVITSVVLQNTMKEAKKISDKHLVLYLMMNQWVKLRQDGKQLSSYFERKGYKSIAIYGMSHAGVTLADELKDTDIQIVYAIDKDAESISSDIKIFSIEDDLEEVDVVVVTAITFFDEVEKILTEKLECPIVSLEDIIFKM